ncbi:hypothetical protein ACOMHN_013393 [Nucella lapillus]
MKHSSLTNWTCERKFGSLDASQSRRRNATLHYHSTVTALKQHRATLKEYLHSKGDDYRKTARKGGKFLRNKHRAEEKAEQKVVEKHLKEVHLQFQQKKARMIEKATAARKAEKGKAGAKKCGKQNTAAKKALATAKRRLAAKAALDSHPPEVIRPKEDDWIGVAYENGWHPGQVERKTEASEEDHTHLINFLYPTSIAGCFKHPPRPDKLLVNAAFIFTNPIIQCTSANFRRTDVHPSRLCINMSAVPTVLEEEGGAAAVNRDVNRLSARAKVKKQTQLEIDKALQDDPSVYEYDSIYDNIQAQKVTTDVKEVHKVDKKPKYIAGLLKMAEVRKREEERRMERKVQKEREEEGEQFADKEAFVTSAYKKKMLEQQAEAEKERREAAMEEMLDVKKQKDLSGFYRYLYRETTGTVPSESPDTEIKEEKVKGKEEPHSDAGSDDAPPARVKVKKEPHSDADSDNTSSAREKKQHTRKDERHASHRDKRQDDDENKTSRSNGSSRHRSGSREKEHRHHHRHHRRSRSRSPSHKRSDKHRRRSRSRDRKRDRSPSQDRTKRSGLGGDKESSRKDQKRRRHSSREEGSPSTDVKDTPAKTSSPPPVDRSSSPEMLPARPPDEDLDRDDSASESDSSAHEASDRKTEGQAGEDSESSRGRKKEEPPKSKGGKKEEEEPKMKYVRKTTETDMSDARQRFLARKLAREGARPVVEPE